MSRMQKGTAGQATAEDRAQGDAVERGSHRRLRAAPQRTEQFVRAFADALHDILHDEVRAAS